MKQKGDGDAKGELTGHDKQKELKGQEQRVAERAVKDDGLIVLQPYKGKAAAGARELILAKRGHDREDGRIDTDGKKRNDRRCKKPERRPGIVPGIEFPCGCR